MLITTGPISPPLQGLKTGMYYLRTRSAAAPIQFTVDQKLVQQVKEEKQKREAEAVLVNGKGEEGHEKVLVNGGMVNGEMVNGEMVNGGMVNGGMVNGGMVNGGMVNGGMVNGEMVNGGMVNGGMNGGMVNGGMVNGEMVNGEMVNGEEEEEEGKVDTESQAYKEALLACSRENREACIMCSS